MRLETGVGVTVGLSVDALVTSVTNERVREDVELAAAAGRERTSSLAKAFVVRKRGRIRTTINSKKKHGCLYSSGMRL